MFNLLLVNTATILILVWCTLYVRLGIYIILVLTPRRTCILCCYLSLWRTRILGKVINKKARITDIWNTCLKDYTFTVVTYFNYAIIITYNSR